MSEDRVVSRRIHLSTSEPTDAKVWLVNAGTEVSSRPSVLSSVYFDLLYAPNVLNIARWVKASIYLPETRRTEPRCKNKVDRPELCALLLPQLAPCAAIC